VTPGRVFARDGRGGSGAGEAGGGDPLPSTGPYAFARQWEVRHRPAAAKPFGDGISGDVPLYVPHDSRGRYGHKTDQVRLGGAASDDAVAASSRPDDFAQCDGQLWGFPTYNWERMKSTTMMVAQGAPNHARALRREFPNRHFIGLPPRLGVPFRMRTKLKGTMRYRHKKATVLERMKAGTADRYEMIDVLTGGTCEYVKQEVREAA